MGGSIDMLRSASDFAALQAGGRSRSHPVLSIRYRRNEGESNRYGISTNRKIGGAVVRNRIRRRLRSILKDLDRRTVVGLDVLIVARPPAASATQAELAAVLESLLRAGGLIGESDR
ncbi:MAG TPA: ribonuclease P protein component [Candidatus Limnocylindria bacterium]|jgi:ribonuclease P protein component|nr:ribonuclease P protein component [Candidatus Limnocylindria bacterium]